MHTTKRLVKRILGMPVQTSPHTDQELKRFRKIKYRSKGMLRPEGYKALYDVAVAAPDLDFVEIGGAAGASSISLALGMKDSQKTGRVIMAEKCEGGSRSKIGDYDTNYSLLTSNLQNFDVTDKVALFPHYLTFENADKFKALIQTEQIGALIHDADGRIDRDFYLFWSMLVDEAPIVIDDCLNKPQFKEKTVRHPDGGTKMLTTYRLTNLFIEWGLFQLDYMIAGTAFGHKPAGADFGKMDLDVCQAVIDQIMHEREVYLESVPA